MKEFNLKERRNLLKKNANLLTKEEILIEVDRQDKEFIKIILKEHTEWRKELENYKVTESFESRVKRRAGEKFR